MKRKTLYSIYRKLESILTPGLKYSQSIYEDVLNEHCTETVKWLDLGCGHRLLPPWRFEQEKDLTSKVKLLVGIDFDYLSLTKHKTIQHKLRGNIYRLPFPDNTFDLITSNMVFEHLDNPEKQLKEISRVLTDKGKIIFHTPNKFSYTTLMARITPEILKDGLIYLLEGRKEEDIFPVYYKINSQSKIGEIAALSGLKVSKLMMICSSALFAVLLPIVFVELIWIKFLLTKMGKPLRTNIIAILEKP